MYEEICEIVFMKIGGLTTIRVESLEKNYYDILIRDDKDR